MHPEVIEYSSEYCRAFHAKVAVSSTGNESDLILEPVRDGESLVMHRPIREINEAFYMCASSVFEDFRFRVPFTCFKCKMLTVINPIPLVLSYKDFKHRFFYLETIILVPKSFSITLDGTSFLCIWRGNLPISKALIMIS